MGNVDYDDGKKCASCGDGGRTYRVIGSKKWRCPACFMGEYGRMVVIE